ncbi:uncharacterized protein LOC135388795 [Ornithodoros turicata]|uniref:uncharacterized protein LOC135388795 n=1 Tax=Ornithodoros turicata TaxID=34597 RepID=UPI003139D903
MEILESNKGGDKLCVGGYLYTKHKPVASGTRWRCVRRRTGCKGAVVCSGEGGDDCRVSASHDHPPDSGAVNIAKARCRMKNMAMSSTERPAAIVAQATVCLTAGEKTLLICEDSLKRCVRAQRSSIYPPQPASLRELIIDGDWALTSGSTPERFLIYDNGPDAENRLVVFAAVSGLRLLSESTLWFMDGNFDVAPKLFKQLYFILVPLGDSAVSVVYAFMTSKTQEAYEELFQAVVDACSAQGMMPSPDVVITDFEKGAMNAVKAILGEELQTRGCFFHLCQSTYSKIQQLGLASRYQDDEDFRHFIGMLDGLAFLPLDDVEAGMNFVKAVAPEGVEAVIAYFDETYVNGTYRHVGRLDENPRIRRTPPRFPPEVWNVHEATLEGGARTNNHSEAWNRRFSSLVGHSHPTVWRAIATLRLEHSAAEGKMTQSLAGAPPAKRQRTTTLQLQERLRRLCQDFVDDRRTLESFLRGVGHAVRLRART